MRFGIKRTREDILFSKIIRKRDNYTCQRCKKQHATNSKGLGASHFYKRAYKWVRHYLDNADALCTACHHRFEGPSEEAIEFKLNQLGNKRFKKLKELKNKKDPFKYEKEKDRIYAELKELAFIYGVE